MASFGEFINDLAKKSGIKEDNEALIAFNQNKEFFEKEIPEELAKSIDNGLLSMETAKNNHPDIKKHYFALALNGVDARVNTIMDELQIPDDVRNVVLNERNSMERVNLLAKKAVELEQKKKAANSDATKESLQKQINELNSQIATHKEAVQKVQEDYEQKIRNFKKQQKVETLFSEYKTVFDDLPAEARISALNALVEKALQDREAELKVDDNGSLVLLRKDGANVFGEDNRQLTPKLLLDTTLSSNKVLKVSDPIGQNQQGNNQNGNGRTTTIVPTNQNGNTNGEPARPSNSKLIALNNQQLADLEVAEKQRVM